MVNLLGIRAIRLAPLIPRAKATELSDPDLVKDIDTNKISFVGKLYVQGSLTNDPGCQYVTPPRRNEIWAKN